MDDAAFLLWTWLRSWEKDFGIKHNTGRAILVVIVMIVNNGDDNDCVGGMVVTIMKVVLVMVVVTKVKVVVVVAMVTTKSVIVKCDKYVFFFKLKLKFTKHFFMILNECKSISKII